MRGTKEGSGTTKCEWFACASCYSVLDSCKALVLAGPPGCHPVCVVATTTGAHTIFCRCVYEEIWSTYAVAPQLVGLQCWMLFGGQSECPHSMDDHLDQDVPVS